MTVNNAGRENTALSRSCALIERVIRALCVCESQLTVRFNCDGTALYVDITANTADAKRIVGRGGSHLAALKSLAAAIVAGSGSRLIVEFNRVESTELPEVPFVRMEPVADFDDTKVAGLFRDIIEACYPDLKVTFMSEPRDERAWTMKAWVETLPVASPRRIYEVSRAVHYLFIPIGMNAGRAVYANVNVERGGDAQTHHAACGTTRPVHVHGAEPHQRAAVVPREHRGELGARDVRLPRLGGAEKSGAAPGRGKR